MRTEAARRLGVLLLVVIQAGIANGRNIDATWVPDDVVVSNPGHSMLDPEYDPVSRYVAWQSGEKESGQGGSSLLVATIDDEGFFLDPLTGVPLHLGGEGLVLDSGLVSLEITRNGPEFALAANGSRLLYSKYNDAGQPSIAQFLFDGANWLSLPTARAHNRITPEGSKVVDDPLPRMAYFDALSREQVGVRIIDMPFTERVVERKLNGANFMPKEAAMLATSALAGGGRQVFYWDYVRNTTTQITYDPAEKLRSPEPWLAPEVANATLFTVLVRVGGVLATRVYRRDADASWQIYTDIYSPDPLKPFMRSPRPFVFNGVSYLVFRSQSEPGNDFDNDIWIVNVGADPDARLYRRLNAPGNTRRADQEAYITATGPVVYYSEFQPGATKLTRRCQTGIPSE